jgi:DNA damage-inducible protein 1
MLSSFYYLITLGENSRTSEDFMRVNPDGSAVNPQAFQQHIRGNSQLMAQLLQVNFAGSFIDLSILARLQFLYVSCRKYVYFFHLNVIFLNLQNDPSLAQAILGDDITELQNILRSHHQQRLQHKRKQEEELVSISSDNQYFAFCMLCPLPCLT